jgi:hypothetical protein
VDTWWIGATGVKGHVSLETFKFQGGFGSTIHTTGRKTWRFFLYYHKYHDEIQSSQLFLHNHNYHTKQENQIRCDAKLQRAVVSEYKQATVLMVKKAAMSPKT